MDAPQPGSKDGTGASDKDTEYRYGNPRGHFTDRERLALLKLRSQLQDRGETAQRACQGAPDGDPEPE